ncbi:MAG: hypothetical protein L6R40_004626 [Gallowayella cf. fulva]|nr:MAG: hypothetical protein L6R40_004626 [Xanthomendoza cf. fulva]
MALQPLRDLNPADRQEIQDAGTRLGWQVTHLGPFPSFFRVEDIPGRGRGCVAVQDISRGTMIHMEAPAFSINNVGNHRTRAVIDQVDNAVLNLNRRVRAELEDLTHPENDDTNIGRFEINNFGMGGGQQGMFLEASRFNHSCLPNACFFWNPHLGANPQGRLTIFATHDISRQEEICVDYQCRSCYLPCVQRQGNLARDYGFYCTCPACDLTTARGQLSEQRRSQMAAIDRVRQHNGTPDLSQRRYLQIQDAIRLVSLLDEESIEFPQKGVLLSSIVQWSLTEYRNLWRKPVNTVFEAGNLRRTALEAARRKLEVGILTVGLESLEARQSLDWIAMLP